MASPLIKPDVATRVVSRDWIESHYVWIVEEALFGATNPQKLAVASNVLDKLARLKGLIVERKQQALVKVSAGQLDRATVRAAAVEMLDQLEPGARAEMRRLLARSEQPAVDIAQSEQTTTDCGLTYRSK